MKDRQSTHISGKIEIESSSTSAGEMNATASQRSLRRAGTAPAQAASRTASCTGWSVVGASSVRSQPAAAAVEDACSSSASLSSAASGSSVPLIAALTWVEWTFRSFAYSGRFQKSLRRETESVNTLLYGAASRNSGD